MFQNIKAKAMHAALLFGIGSTLVTLANQVQTALDMMQPLIDPPAPPQVVRMPDSLSFGAGYIAGWNDGAAGEDPKITDNQEGTSDE